MSGVTLPSEPIQAPAPRLAVQGVGQVHYERSSDGRARLAHLYQRDPVRVLFPNPPRHEIQSAVFVTTSGGLVGGDVLALSAQTAEGVAVQFTAQAAEKIYRSNGLDASVSLTLRAAGESWLEWLPQEAILFDGACLDRVTNVHITAASRILAGEILVFGRQARGERFTHGRVQEAWNVYRDGSLVWADRFRLADDTIRAMTHPAGLDYARAIATIIYAGDGAAELLTGLRDIDDRDDNCVRMGVSMVQDLLLVRLLAQDSAALRRRFAEAWATLRQGGGGLPPWLPRLWHI